MRKARYRPGDVVPKSGIYRVRHRTHRLVHEVTLLKDEWFPRCKKCDDVSFELIKAVRDVEVSPVGFRAILEPYRAA